MGSTFWNIETNEGDKVAGPYATVQAAMEARWYYFPTLPKLYVVEYEIANHPPRAAYSRK